ncbi:MAG: glycosyltransferase family 4 protein [Elusimicrobiota bacterium]
MIKPRVVVLTSRCSAWTSLEEIVRALEKAWGIAGLRSRADVRFLRVGKEFGEDVFPLDAFGPLLRADMIAVAVLTPSIARLLYALRRWLKIRTPLIIHSHGEGTTAGLRFGPLAKALTRDDLLLAASRREARCLRLCWPSVRVEVLPFPIADAGGRRATRRGAPALVYAGRLSEQKNLHTLLLSLSMLDRLKPGLRWSLHVYGKADGLGSPNMGFRMRSYSAYLRSLARRLRIEKRIAWRGFLPARELRRALAGRHVFVSPSLHSDEDFGTAALTSLLTGNSAVLSDWGGHSDLKKNFPGQVRLVRSVDSDLGPYVPADRLARAILKALRQARAPGAPARSKRLYSVRECARRLIRRSRIAPPLSGKASPLSGLARSLIDRTSRLRKKSQAIPYASSGANPYAPMIFASYGDENSKPFFEAYGLVRRVRRSRGTSMKGLAPVPWMKLSKRLIVALDPHRGRWTLRRDKIPEAALASWLLSNGLAYRIPQAVRSPR